MSLSLSLCSGPLPKGLAAVSTMLVCLKPAYPPRPSPAAAAFASSLPPMCTLGACAGDLVGRHIRSFEPSGDRLDPQASRCHAWRGGTHLPTFPFGHTLV